MKMKKGIALCLCLCLGLAAVLSGCGSNDGAVFVQSVSYLMKQGGIAPGDRFGGMVVSENVSEIQKDGEKTIAEVLVREGDDVKQGDALFSYDTDELKLTLEKQELERDQLSATIENYKAQITELEKDRDRSYGNNKLQYTIQIQTMQVSLKETELSLKSKEAEVTQSRNILENATVVSPVTGRVQAVNENGTDNYGNPLPYITIQQSGSFRIKGTINELQRGSLTEGMRLRIFSRTDASQFWNGTVSLVDYENPTTGNDNNMYYAGSSDEMVNSSKYPFYVELDSSDGLLLGQHLYMELEGEDGMPVGPCISSAFVCYEEDSGEPYVWADNGRGKLEKRSITVSDFNAINDTVEVISGLIEADYIAFPDEELCHSGAPTTRTAPSAENGSGAEGAPVAEGGV